MSLDTRSNRMVARLALLGGALAIVAPNAAWAQTSSPPTPAPTAGPAVPVSETESAAQPDRINEIVVTAQRSLSTVQKVPLAVSAFDSRAIAAKQITNVLTLINNVPNFSGANNVTLPTAVSLFIRGIGATDSSVTADPPVGLYIDDVIVARQQLNNAGVFDLQRVEVLRGPQGTLYGRNTAAGAIKLISNPPVNNYEGWLEGGLGNYGMVFGRGVINAPIVDGKLMARVNFGLSHRNGLTENLTTGKFINDLDTSSIRGALRFVASDAIELNLKADVSRVYSNGVVGTDVAGTYVPATGDLFKVHSGDDPYNVGKTHGVNFYIDWKLSPELAAKAISGYRYTYQNYSFDFSDQPIPVYINASTARTRQYSQELQLIGAYPRFDFVGGLFYMRETAQQIYGPQTFMNYSRVGGVFPAPGTPNVPRDAAFIYTEDFRLKTSSYAAYFQGSYEVIDSLKAEVGVRYTTDTKSYVVSANQGPVGAPLPLLFTTADVVTATGQQPRKTFSQFTPHFGLNYQVTPDTLLYASFTRGFQSGGFFGRVRAPAGLIAYPATIVTSYESGLKTTFLDGRARFNVTGFYAKQKDLPVSYASQERPGTFAVASLAPVVWGLEVESALRLARGLQVNGSLGWLDYKYDNFDKIPAPVRPSIGPNLRFSPHYTAKVGFDYQTLVGDGGWGLRLSNNYAYSSDQHTNTANTPAGFSKARVLVDAAITLEAPEKRYAVSISCTNCTDKRYVGNSLDFGGVRGGGLPVSIVFPGEPRMYQASIRANF